MYGPTAHEIELAATTTTTTTTRQLEIAQRLGATLLL
jgi:hypothetical protein